MRVITVEEVLWLNEDAIDRWGGKLGVLNVEGLASAVAAPFQSFDGRDLYPTLAAKAAALGFYIVRGHHFLDGNKRTGFWAMATLLELNGACFAVEWFEAEDVLVRLADGVLPRPEWERWVASKIESTPTKALK